VPVELPWGWIFLLNVAGWLIIQLSLAWIFTVLPLAAFNPAEPADIGKRSRAHKDIFAVRRWKGLLPDGARWLGGGFAKKTLAGTDPSYLRRFIRETRRGEMCHWVAIACAPVFFVWNPWWGDLIIIVYAFAANLPCILTQRFNRSRLWHLVSRHRSARIDSAPMPGLAAANPRPDSSRLRQS